MNKWLVPLAVIGSVGYFVLRSHKAAALAPTVIPSTGTKAGATPIDLTGITPVTATLTPISSPPPLNPFLGGNPFLNF